MPKLRLQYTKTGLIRFISHRDLMRVFFRALQRAKLPVLYSQGFSPHPRVEFCPPLKVGMEGLNELMDVRLETGVDPAEAGVRLQAALPGGITVRNVRLLPDPADSLGKVLEAAQYRVFLPAGVTVSREAVEKFLARRQVWLEMPRAGRVRRVDARSGVFRLELLEAGLESPHPALVFSLKSGSPPESVLIALTGRRPEELRGARWQRLRFTGKEL